MRSALLSTFLLAATLPAQDPLPRFDGWEAGYDGGFFLRSADGHNEIKLEGLVQVGANWFQSDRGRTSEFDLRRARPELVGKLAEWVRFKLEPNFQDDGVELEEAWIGGDIGEGCARVMVGRMKAPFNLEEVRSRRYIDFPRFSIVNQFAPAEDHGIFVNGTACGGVFEYGLAAYNGTGSSDTTSSKDFAGRAMWHPFTRDEGHCLQNLQLGVAGTWGRQDEVVTGKSIDNAAGQAVIDFASGTRLDGERVRAGLELAWFRGPVMLQNARTLSGTGAWILAVRLSELRADSSLRALGLASANRFTRSVRSVSVGLNWVLNGHMLLRNAYVHSFYSDRVMLGNGMHDHEGALMLELQLHF